MKRVSILAGVLMIIAGSVSAQKTGTDQVPAERTITRREEMRADLQEARQFGPFRVLPSFDLHNLGYESNVFGTDDDPVSDWRATVTAGADLILPAGSKNYLIGTVKPQYTWYNKLANRRSLGGTYGATWLALYNRLMVETGVQSERVTAPVSSEVERTAKGNGSDVFVRTELDLLRRLAIYGSAQRQRQRFEDIEGEGALDLNRLERDATVVTGGILYRFRSYLSFSAGVESGKTEFVSATDRDNTTNALIFGVNYNRPRVFVNLSAGSRETKADGPQSRFPPFSSTTGSYYIEYQMGAPARIDFSGHRALVYSVTPGSPYFSETRSGIGVTVPIGARFGVRGLTELGANDYPTAGINGIKRKDNVTTVGGGIAMRVVRNTYVSLIASETRYDSNLAFDRTIFRVSTVISLRGQSFQ